MTIEVRSAVTEDARGIAEVHVRAWQEAYAHLVPSESLARLSVDQRELRWREILAVDDGATWVALDDGVIIGFAGTGAPRPDQPQLAIELHSIYVLESSHGSGAGQRLIDSALGDQPAYLWVAENNPRARAFYSRNRFVADGARETHSLAGTPVTAIRMVR
jgi:ribosomal protein S18 acetylase RimI-like enzyme